MNNVHSFTSILTQSLGWALCHSIWQGLAVFVIVKLLLKAINPKHAAMRYNVSLLGLATITLWFADTFVAYWQKLQGIAVTITEASESTMHSKTITALPVYHTADRTGIASIFHKLEAWFPVIVSIYTLGIAFFLIRLSYQLYRVNTLRTKGISLPSTATIDRFLSLKDLLGIKRRISVVLSNHIHVPAMIGTLKPVILLPVASINNLSTEQLDAILLHELAHIKRYDYLVNLLQTIVETILFFNPAVWFLSGIIRQEREHCCDDIVLTHSYPLSYAKALTAIGTSHTSMSPLAIGAAGTSKNQLLHRIKRMMEPNTNAVSNMPLIMALVAGIVLILAICFSPSFAQSKKTGKKQSQKKEEKTQVTEETYTNDKNSNDNASDDLPVSSATPTYDNDDSASWQVVPPAPPVPPVPGTTVAPVVPSVPSVAALPAMPDVDKIVKDALAAVNWQEVGDDIDAAMREINWKDIDSSIEASMKEAENAIEEVDWKKMQAEMQASVKGLSKAEQKRIKADLEKAKVESRKAMMESRKAVKESRKALEKSRIALLQSRETVRKAREEQRKSEIELRGKEQDPNGRVIPQELINEIAADGLLDTAKGYRLYIDHDKLVINGKKQPASVHERYLRKYGKYFNSIKTSKNIN